MKTIVAAMAIGLVAFAPQALAQPQMQIAQQAQAPTDCDCKEMRNIKNRLCGTRLAQREYDRVSSKFLADEKAKGQPILLDGTIKENITNCVQEAINMGTDQGAQDATSETNAVCAIEDVYFTHPELDASRCIGMSVYRHELFHQARCKERESGKWQQLWAGNAPVTTLLDTKFAMTAVDFMAEEAAAYSLEEAELTRALRRLVETCYSDDKVATVEDDDWVPGKKKGDEYRLDLSLEGCPARPRNSDKGCPY